jgi:hypothetical protein
MDQLRLDAAIAAMHSIMEILPPETYARETPAQISWEIQRRLMALLECYDVQVGIAQRRFTASEN